MEIAYFRLRELKIGLDVQFLQNISPADVGLKYQLNDISASGQVASVIGLNRRQNGGNYKLVRVAPNGCAIFEVIRT